MFGGVVDLLLLVLLLLLFVVVVGVFVVVVDVAFVLVTGVCEKNARCPLSCEFIKHPPGPPHFNVDVGNEQRLTKTSVFFAGRTDPPHSALNIAVGGIGGA